MTTQLYDTAGNYDFIGINDDGTFDGLETSLSLLKTENVYNAHEGDSISYVTTNKPV